MLRAWAALPAVTAALGGRHNRDSGEQMGGWTAPQFLVFVFFEGAPVKTPLTHMHTSNSYFITLQTTTPTLYTGWGSPSKSPNNPTAGGKQGRWPTSQLLFPSHTHKKTNHTHPTRPYATIHADPRPQKSGPHDILHTTGDGTRAVNNPARHGEPR